jgi:hypothetical protein
MFVFMIVAITDASTVAHSRALSDVSEGGGPLEEADDEVHAVSDKTENKVPAARPNVRTRARGMDGGYTAAEVTRPRPLPKNDHSNDRYQILYR